jgi:tRNA(Ile)-lysidine synthase
MTPLCQSSIKNPSRQVPVISFMKCLSELVKGVHLGYNLKAMIDQLRHILASVCLLDISQPVLVGVSGGADSLCLMDVLASAGYCLTVAHLNHSLRAEADAEAVQVQDYARKLGVDFIGDKIDVQRVREDEHLTLEEAARKVRYQFLFEKGRSIGAQAVAVAHTADDQVETILMHLLRGAGLAGLKGMLYRTLPTSWSREIPLVRPLLGTWRSEVLEYILSRGYEPVYDSSNLDITYSRNRLRHELLPMLETYQPGARRRLWQTGEVLREDYLYIQEQVRSAWNACVLSCNDSGVVFARQPCLEQPKAIQRSLLKMCIETLRPGIRNLDFHTLERAQRFFAQPTRTGKIELSDGLFLSQHGDHLVISAAGSDPFVAGFPKLVPGGKLIFEPPGMLNLEDGWALHAKIVSNSTALMELIQANTDPYQAWLDADGVNLPFTVRSRLPGDRFTPLGMAGHSMKLSDFMVNVKLPKAARPGWPLVCGNCHPEGAEMILWVPGLRQSNFCRVTAETRQIIRLSLEGDRSAA